MSGTTPETSSEPYHRLMNNYLDEQLKEPYLDPEKQHIDENLENQLDYSADDSVSNSFGSPNCKPSDGLFHYKKGAIFSSRTKRTTIPTSSIGWLDSFDEKENNEQDHNLTITSLSNHPVKFVNGLPTVVTRATPTKFYCLKCNHKGTTKVRERMGKGAWILSSVLFLTLFWPCLAVVCCSNKCKDYVHECPRCGHVVGKKRFIL